jgi:hypothetical protein
MNRELVLLVRRPPGRGYLYRFAGATVTAGADPACALHLPDAGVALALRFDRGPEGWRVADAHGLTRPIGTADALTAGPYLIEITVEDLADGPTTDRTESDRIAGAIEAERRVRAADGPSIWVLRGGAGGAALPVPREGVLRCGSGPDDALRLPDAGVEPHHFELTLVDGTVRLVARAPVRVRGVVVSEALLVLGDLIFVGGAICEVRMPGDEADLPIGRPGPALLGPESLASESLDPTLPDPVLPDPTLLESMLLDPSPLIPNAPDPPPEPSRRLIALGLALFACALLALAAAWWQWGRDR